MGRRGPQAGRRGKGKGLDGDRGSRNNCAIGRGRQRVDSRAHVSSRTSAGVGHERNGRVVVPWHDHRGKAGHGVQERWGEEHYAGRKRRRLNASLQVYHARLGLPSRTPNTRLYWGGGETTRVWISAGLALRSRERSRARASVLNSERQNETLSGVEARPALTRGAAASTTEKKKEVASLWLRPTIRRELRALKFSVSVRSVGTAAPPPASDGKREKAWPQPTRAHKRLRY